MVIPAGNEGHQLEKQGVVLPLRLRVCIPDAACRIGGHLKRLGAYCGVLVAQACQCSLDTLGITQ